MDALPLLYGIGTALPLVVGAGIGVFFNLPRTAIAALLAFASGSLITGLAFKLFEPAFQTAGPLLTTVSALTGTGLYVAVKSSVSTSSASDGVDRLRRTNEFDELQPSING